MDPSLYCKEVTSPTETQEDDNLGDMMEEPPQPPSPNLQTRSIRRTTGNSIAKSYSERERVARVRREFADDDTKPCSVFGYDRHKRYRGGFFFCGECQKADDFERFNPGHFVNRRSKEYACTASHDNIIQPSDRIKIISMAKPPPSQKRASSSTKRGRQVEDNDTNDDNTCSAHSIPRKKQRKPPSNTTVTSDKIFEDSDDTSVVSVNVPDPHQVPTQQGVPVFPNNELNPDHTHQPPNPSSNHDPRSVQTPPNDSTTATLNPSEANSDNSRPVYVDKATQTDSVSMDSGKDIIIEALRVEVEKLSRKNGSVRRRVKEQRETIKSHLNEISKLQKRITRLEAKHGKIPKSCSTDSNIDKLVAHIQAVIVESIRNHNGNSHRAKKFFRQLSRMLLNTEIHYNQLSECLTRCVQRHLRKTVFTPYNILQAMDFAGGTLNYGGIEILRQVETGGKKRKHTMIPSTSAIRRCASLIESFADCAVPYRPIRNKNTGSEGFYFRAADVFVAILKAAGMLKGEARQRAIRFAQSLDGATLTKSLSHVLGGIKFNDKGCPLKSQSRDMVFPLVCIIGRETKSIVRGLFSRMIKEIQEASDKVLPAMHAIVALKIVTNCDMSVDWKLSGRGGAAKNATYPCSKCFVRSDELHTKTGELSQCKWCLHHKYIQHDKEWKCRHFPMTTEEQIAGMKEQVDKFEEDMPELSEQISDVWKKSAIHINIHTDPRVPPLPTLLDKVNSIHFDIDVATDRRKRQVYSSNLNKDLELRDLPISGSLAERQRRLKQSHIAEWTYVDASTTISKAGEVSVTTALVMVMDTVPCLLHMEMRLGIKILSMLFKTGLTNCKQDLLPWIEEKDRSSLDRKCRAFIDGLETILNEKILGSHMLPTQESLPFDKKQHVMGELKLNNGKVRQIIPLIELLVEKCIVDEADKARWLVAMDHYRLAMKILLLRRDVTDQEVMTYQKHADLFFKEWLLLFAEEGITNYMHLIGSGHVGEYLLHWKSLYAHSQQGWEAFNSLFKSFYFSRTQRGGATNQGLGERSRLKPVAKWLQRRLVFFMGHTMESIYEYMSSRTVEVKRSERDWVRKSGGTIEFGQLIQQGDDNSSEFDSSEDKDGEGSFTDATMDDWDIGTQELYGTWNKDDEAVSSSSEESKDDDWW